MDNNYGASETCVGFSATNSPAEVSTSLPYRFDDDGYTEHENPLAENPSTIFTTTVGHTPYTPCSKTDDAALLSNVLTTISSRTFRRSPRYDKLSKTAISLRFFSQRRRYLYVLIV